MREYLIFTEITDGIREKSNNIFIRLFLGFVLLFYIKLLFGGVMFIISPQPTLNLQTIKVFAIIAIIVFFLYVLFFLKNQKNNLYHEIFEAEKGTFKNNYDTELNNKGMDINIIKPSDFGSIEITEDVNSKKIIYKIPEIILILCGILFFN